MDELVGECVHGRRVDGRIGGRMRARTEGGWMNRWANVFTDGGWMDEQLGECVHGRRVDGRIGGRMCARTEGGWMVTCHMSIGFWRRFSDRRDIDGISVIS
jgi:hypothetical protein